MIARAGSAAQLVPPSDAGTATVRLIEAAQRAKGVVGVEAGASRRPVVPAGAVCAVEVAEERTHGGCRRIRGAARGAQIGGGRQASGSRSNRFRPAITACLLHARRAGTSPAASSA